MKRIRLGMAAASALVYAAAAAPALTGYAVHEWLGVALLLVLAVHMALSLDKALAWFKSAFARPSPLRAGRAVLLVALLACLAACLMSGFMVSGAVLPLLGYVASGYYFWKPLHAASAMLLLALLIVHVLLNWQAVVHFFGRGSAVSEEGAEGDAGAGAGGTRR